MKVPSGLDFSNIKEKRIFDNSSKEYKKMISMDDEYEWREYTNEMLSKGISVIYDASGDFFLAKPVAFKESKMKQKKSSENYLTPGNKLTWFDSNNKPQKGVVLESNNSTISVYNSLTGEVQDIEKSQLFEAAKKSKLNEKDDRYLLYDDDEELENEVEDDIDLESSHDDLIHLSDDEVENDYEITNDYELDQAKELTPAPPVDVVQGQFTMEDLQRIVSEIMSGTGSGSQVQVNDKFHSGEAGTVDQDAEPTNDILGSEFAESQEDVANVESKIENEETYLEYLQGPGNQVQTAGEEFEIYEEPEGVEYESEIIEEDNDLEFLSPADYEDGDLDSPEVLEPAEVVQPGSVINHRGVPIKVQITGWLITMPEVNALAEAVKKSGGRLRGLGSKNEKFLTLVVESNNKLHKILYEDRSKVETQKPWSIGKLRFTSLTEAVKNANKVKISDKEKFFRKLIGEDKDLNSRKLDTIREADIFDDFKHNDKNKMNYVEGWNVRSVGQLDLKKGLNEVFSNITEGSKRKNTLFKTKSGQYYLLRGNLGESSKKGVKKELVDLEKRRNYGEGQVVGIYENTMKGLGQIMFKIKRTSIPMMVWK